MVLRGFAAASVFIAIAHTLVNRDVTGGTAPDAMVWSGWLPPLRSFPRPRAQRVLGTLSGLGFARVSPVMLLLLLGFILPVC